MSSENQRRHNNAFNHESCRPDIEVKCVKEFVFEMVQSVGRQDQVNAPLGGRQMWGNANAKTVDGDRIVTPTPTG